MTAKDQVLKQISLLPEKSYVVGVEWPDVFRTLFYTLALRSWGQTDVHGGSLAVMVANKTGVDYYTALIAVQLAATARTKAEAKELATMALEGHLTI